MSDSYATYTDAELTKRLMLADREAFTEIYNRYWDKLFYTAGKKLKDLGEAENLIQEIFMDLWRRREEITITSELSHYLAAALRYRIINLHARQARQIAFLKHQSLTKVISAPLTEESVDHALLQQQLQAIVATLPEKCRLVFTLRQEGYSRKEIADQLQVSENTIETHVHRALKIIRTAIAPSLYLLFRVLD